MDEQQVQSIKEQVFGQSPTQAPTPTNIVPETPVVEISTEVVQTAEPVVAVTSITPNEEILDGDVFAKSLGYENLDALKADVPQLKQFKETAPKPIEYANEESKKVHELLLAGKVKDVKAIYDLQEKLEGVEQLTPAEAIKLHIEQTNKHFKKADVEDVFEEKYSYPEKPEQGVTEEDDAFEARENRYKEAVEKINRRIERDSVSAKNELAKLKTEIVLPEIYKEKSEQELAFEKYVHESQETSDLLKTEKEAFSKFTPQELKLEFKFNDEASKLAFDINYEPDKDTFSKAVEDAADLGKFVSNFYATEDGSPQRQELLKVIYAGQNIDKIVTEAVIKATNETKAWFLRNQKNIGDGTQRNFNVMQPSEIDKLREQIFSKS